MSLLITEATINKLGHKIPEIRQRAFIEVQNKLNQSIVNGEELVFNSNSLYKTLIECLKDGTNKQSDVLELIFLLFKTRYAVKLVQFVGINRVRRDTQNAIRKVAEAYPQFNSRIKEFLSFLSRLEADMDLSHDFDTKLNLNRNKVKLDHIDLELPESDYVKRWSIPDETDFQEMQKIKFSLMDHHNVENIQHALKFIEGSVKNLPAEYFLQPPYLFKSLFDCVLIENCEKSVLTILCELTGSLLVRIKHRILTRTCEFVLEEEQDQKCQLSVQAYCYHLFMTIMNAFKEVNHTSQEQLNMYFELMNSVINVLRYCRGNYENRAILRELTFLARFYREQYQSSKENFNYRVNYLIVLQKIVSLANIRSTNEHNNEVIINEGDGIPIWKQELKVALLDLSLRDALPEVYYLVYQMCEVDNDERLHEIINSSIHLSPAIEILRNPDKFNDEELVMNGLQALNTLKIHQSKGLVKKLMNAVIDCAPYFNGNLELKEAGEKLLLRLISTNIKKLKLTAYEIAINAVVNFIGQVHDGMAGVLKRYETDNSSSCYMGIPINSDILTELIFFGLTNENEFIKNAADKIITYIVNGRNLFGKHWKRYFDVLSPLLPILQAVVSEHSSLGRGIFNILNPDFEIPTLDCIHGNMRYLFFQESQTREDAMIRLLYLTSNHPNSMNYLPNIEHLRNTLSNSFCIVRHQLPLRNPLKSGIFDVKSLRDLIEILKCQDTSPKVRYSTLVQLNAFVDDPTLCDMLIQQNDWPFILVAFENSMKVHQNRDYPDSAVPALQIITKLCIRNPELRRNLKNDIDFNRLLLRAMFMHHHDTEFRHDGATLVFIMAFCDFIIGEDDLLLPEAFSGLFIPFQCQYHFKTSPYDVTSLLESMFLEENEEAYDDLVIIIDEETSPKANRKTKFSNQNEPMSEMWQYLRLLFTTIWFGEMDAVLENIKKNSSTSKTGLVDYQNHSGSTATENGSETILDFNPLLELQESDLNIMKISSLSEIVKHNIHLIENVTTHREAAAGICGIKSIIFLPHAQEYYSQEFLKSIKRFVVSHPNTDDDEYIFKLVVDTIKSLIDIGYDKILSWVMMKLNEPNGIFMRLLRDTGDRYSVSLYTKIVDLIGTVIKLGCISNDPKLKEILYGQGYVTSEKNQDNLVLRVFEIISDELGECDKDRILALLALLKTITQYAKLETDETLLNKVIAQLFCCLKLTRSLTQSGSFITKNCLLSIGHILKYIKEPSLDTKLIRNLSTLCCHTDLIVRACSWNILSSVAEGSLNGAKQVVNELSYLPGGIHACIIQTVLDIQEVSLVKGAAATLFVKLLSYTNEQKLHRVVWPKCNEKINVSKKTDLDGYELLKEILHKQQFLERSREALECFTPNIYNEIDQDIHPLTSPDTVIHLSNILIAVFDVRPSSLPLSENEKLTLEAFIKCISTVIPINASATTLTMVSNVCNLISRYLSIDNSLLEVILHNTWFMISLLKLLDLEVYDSEENCEKISVNILNLIKIIGMSNEGYEHFCASLERVNLDRLMDFFNIILMSHKQLRLIIAAMDCLTILTLNADMEVNNSHSFHIILDTKTINDRISNKNNDEESLKPISEILADRLIQIFDMVCDQDKPDSCAFLISDLKLSCYNCLQTLFRYTVYSKEAALSQGIFQKLINRLDVIYSSAGMNRQDFIRKYGDRKKEPIVRELDLLASLIANLYYKKPMINETDIQKYLKSVSQMWEWYFVDHHINMQYYTVLMVLSEESLPFCKAMSVIQVNNSNSYIQSIAEMAKGESQKATRKEINQNQLIVMIRILINCCSCVEGRVQLAKLKVLDTLDHIYPSGSQKHNHNINKIIHIWLEFYEIFSRYPEGAQARHLSIMCTIIRKNIKNLKSTAIKILRNMAFDQSNRAALLTSPDYIYIVRQLLEQGEDEERLQIIVSLWSMVANNCKAKNEIKNSVTFTKLNNLSNSLAVNRKSESDVYRALTCLLNVLNRNN